MNDEKLIPDLQDWRKYNGKDFSIEDWIRAEGNVRFMIGYSFLLWPDFTEYDGCIILKAHFNESNFENWKNTESIKNYAQIESVLNHIHILDLVGTDEKKDEVTYEQILFLGNRFCDIYSTKLQTEFPEKKFIINFNGNERVNSFEEYQITFYQEKNLNRKTKFAD
ncbi:hypothetical protein SAMN05443633_101491 [Chryseobacterium arachidis]|uniref:Uncharacterized protein n=1 Tax=Chryseobacterium arachidis TaxID=1416778 RepID=A0A1M4UFR8_9FLAO|nr:hypothetical protein [Chryseobacterium arachidis]SHE55535.1 hypothetical protein SAMN05443633_101491 [Chryseobacterium arachidis]